MEPRELQEKDLTKVAGGAVDLEKRPTSEKVGSSDTGSGSGAASSGGGPGTVVFGQNQPE